MYRSLGRLIGHRTVIASVAALAVGFTACSMHPLPEDVTGVSTYDIVEKIRCEAAEGLQAVLAQNTPREDVEKIITDGVIGYDFSFEIDEDNNATKGQLKFVRPGFRKGSQTTWDLTGSSTRKRKNKREFRIVETLEGLRKKEDCEEGRRRANWVYPITGAIGVDEVIHTYVNLELTARFEKKKKDDTRGDLPVVFSDELTYTTEFGGGIQPTLELATIAGKFRLNNMTLLGEAKRKDVHSVTVALARKDRKLASRMFQLFVNSRAAIALAQAGADSDKGIVVLELERRRRAKEDENLNTRLLDALRLPQ